MTNSTTPLDGAVVAQIYLMPLPGVWEVDKKFLLGYTKPDKVWIRVLQCNRVFAVLIPVLLLCDCTSSLGVSLPLTNFPSLCLPKTCPTILCTFSLPLLPLTPHTSLWWVKSTGTLHSGNLRCFHGSHVVGADKDVAIMPSRLEFFPTVSVIWGHLAACSCSKFGAISKMMALVMANTVIKRIETLQGHILDVGGIQSNWFSWGPSKIRAERKLPGALSKSLILRWGRSELSDLPSCCQFHALFSEAASSQEKARWCTKKKISVDFISYSVYSSEDYQSGAWPVSGYHLRFKKRNMKTLKYSQSFPIKR